MRSISYIAHIPQHNKAPSLIVDNQIPKHLHKPGFDDLVEDGETVFGVLLQCAKPIKFRRDAPLGGEGRERNLH